jgi:hypothetical protein
MGAVSATAGRFLSKTASTCAVGGRPNAAGESDTPSPDVHSDGARADARSWSLALIWVGVTALPHMLPLRCAILLSTEVPSDP